MDRSAHKPGRFADFLSHKNPVAGFYKRLADRAHALRKRDRDHRGPCGILDGHRARDALAAAFFLRMDSATEGVGFLQSKLPPIHKHTKLL